MLTKYGGWGETQHCDSDGTVMKIIVYVTFVTAYSRR